MYRLVLEAPFEITLVHRDVFEREVDAQLQAGRLPVGFKTVPSDKVPCHAMLVPVRTVRECGMKPEEIRMYAQAGELPIQPGDTVYVPRIKERGSVISLDGNQVQVRLDSSDGSQILSLSAGELMRVSGSA